MKEKKNRKKLFLTLGLLFGLAGVGTAAFAGYVLADTNITNPGDTQLEPVIIVDESYDITATIHENEKLAFYPTTADTDNAVLQYDGIPEANLDLQIDVTATGGEDLSGKNITVTVSADGEGNAVTSGYITLPDPTSLSKTFAESLNYTFTFGWGERFGNTDPVAFYSAEEDKETISTAMNAFNTALQATTIKFVVTVTDATA